jgi:hypothetical protein
MTLIRISSRGQLLYTCGVILSELYGVVGLPISIIRYEEKQQRSKPL